MHIDAVFPVLHGKSGEDGAVQGLLELSGIPYVGCDIQSSAICMDKSLAYVVARSAGIDTPEFWVLDGADTAVPDELAYPVFVKPARSGSSFGVTKVERADELDAALTAARRTTARSLIEQAIVGTEVGCAVLGNGSDLIVGEVDQIKLLHGIFRIHQEAEPETGLRERGRSPFPRTCRTPNATRYGKRRSPSTRHSAARVSPEWTCSCRTTDGSCSTRSTPCPGSRRTAAIPA